MGRNRLETLEHAASRTLSTSGKVAKAAGREVIELPGELLRARGATSVLLGLTGASIAANEGILDSWTNTVLFGMGITLTALGIKQDAKDQRTIAGQHKLLEFYIDPDNDWQQELSRVEMAQAIADALNTVDYDGWDGNFVISEEAVHRLERVISPTEKKK